MISNPLENKMTIDKSTSPAIFQQKGRRRLTESQRMPAFQQSFAVILNMRKEFVPVPGDRLTETAPQRRPRRMPSTVKIVGG